ncbi:hypothetical protein Droror1_Dr00009539 [Drosera rotundifolia]
MLPSTSMLSTSSTLPQPPTSTSPLHFATTSSTLPQPPTSTSPLHLGTTSSTLPQPSFVSGHGNCAYIFSSDVRNSLEKHEREVARAVIEKAKNLVVSSIFCFNAEMPPPSSITYMGPVSYSGNISLRSESSAGSARSFAFPVLQTEWHGSPVRMARADQRRMRKNRGWLQVVICCRF